ncbi:MAG: hypothetical protein QM645_04705 [Asticcacaulis sp.]
MSSEPAFPNASAVVEAIRHLKPEAMRLLSRSEASLLREDLRADIARLQALAEGYDDQEKALSEDVLETLKDVRQRIEQTLNDFLRLGDESQQPAPPEQGVLNEDLRQISIRLERLITAAEAWFA